MGEKFITLHRKAREGRKVKAAAALRTLRPLRWDD